MSNLRVGTIVNGTVVEVYDNLAYIDVGAKTEGQIYLEYFTSKKDVKSLKDCIKPGDQIKVQIQKITLDSIYLSRLDMEEKERRDKIIKKIMNHKPFMATVKAKNKNDEFILEKDGVSIILPDRYVDLDDEFDKDSLIGTETKVVFVKTETDEKGKTRFIVSRKQVQYNEQKKAREEEFESINVNDTVTGKVVRLADFGAFIKLKNIEGLCHLSEISHYRIKTPSEALSVDDTVTALVIKKTETKLYLSIKALTKTPWEIFIENHKVGDELECTIVKKSEKYMLCSPERDIVGILNQSDYSWNIDDNFAGTVEEGDKINLKITYLDKEKNRITFSKKHLEYNPWQDVHFKPHEIVTGTVERFTNTGCFVKVGNVEGFISNRDSSDENKSAQEVFNIGDIINAEVIVCNPQRWLLTLSVRSIKERENRAYVDKYLEENVSSSSTLEDLLKEE